MFSVRIQYLESSPPELAGESNGKINRAANTDLSPGSCLRVFRGVLHLYRNYPPSSFSSTSSLTPPPPPAGRGTHLLILAVPGRLTLDDFKRFCGKCIQRATGIWVVRNDATEDRYSVLVEFDDQKTAYKFFLGVNGWSFTTEGEVCRALFIGTVELTEFTDTDGTAPAGSTELPTCPVCIERLDQEIIGMSASDCDNSFKSPSISKWVCSSCSVCQFCQKHSDKPTCSICGTSQNLWICMICGFVGCGRNKDGHARRHWKDTQHFYYLDLETQRIWDYVGCGCSDESRIGEDLLRSKIEAKKDECDRLLASQLKSKKQYYENLIQEKKDKKGKYISEAVEKAVYLKTQDIKLQICEVNREIKTITATNKKLEKEQTFWQQRVEAAKVREREYLQMLDEEIQDTQEEMIDYMFFIESRKKHSKEEDACDTRGGGTELPKSASPPPSSGKAGRRSSRSSRRKRK